MHHTLRKLMGGRGISTAELTRLLKSPDGAVALAALSRAHIKHREATAELKRPPRQQGHNRTVDPNPAAKRGPKAPKKRPI